MFGSLKCSTCSHGWKVTILLRVQSFLSLKRLFNTLFWHNSHMLILHILIWFCTNGFMGLKMSFFSVFFHEEQNVGDSRGAGGWGAVVTRALHCLSVNKASYGQSKGPICCPKANINIFFTQKERIHLCSPTLVRPTTETDAMFCQANRVMLSSHQLIKMQLTSADFMLCYYWWISYSALCFRCFSFLPFDSSVVTWKSWEMGTETTQPNMTRWRVFEWTSLKCKTWCCYIAVNITGLSLCCSINLDSWTPLNYQML